MPDTNRSDINVPEIHLPDVTDLVADAQEPDFDDALDLDSEGDSLEAPAGDVAEQRRPVGGALPSDLPAELPVEVDPADRQEQLQEVELDDDGYDR